MADNLERLILDIITRDHASEGLSKISRNAELASEHTDTLQKRLTELGQKTARAKVELAGDKEAQARLDAISARLLSLDRRTATGRVSVEGAARAIAEMAALDAELDKVGGGPGGAGGSALSAGSALGKLSNFAFPALIAGGVALSPVIATLGVGLGGLGLAAVSAAGNTKKFVKELAPLKDEFHAFGLSLQPQVLALMNTGFKIAGELLHDIQPIAAATGKALGGVLAQVDAEFKSGTWQQFFSWMAREAGPDVKLVGDNLVTLMNDIPPLIEELQPLATALLQVTNALGKTVGATQQLDPNVHKAIAAGGFWNQVWHDLGFAMSYNIPAAADKTSKAIYGTGKATAVAATEAQFLVQQVRALTNAYNAGLSPLLAYTNAQITQRDDAVKLAQALKGSHDQVGLNTAAQRASFSAANTYIQDLLNTAAAADKSGHGIGDQIANIRAALPQLEHVKGGTRDYWREVQSLVGWLHRLEQMRNISEGITILGNGKWVNQATGTVGGLGGHTARGWLVQGGTPGVDSVPIMAMPGELVVPTAMVRAGAVDHLRGMIPGFAAGGIVPSYAGNLAGLQPWAQHNWTATIGQITAAVASSMARSFWGGGGPGGGSPAANAALARSMFPVNAMAWAAWNYVAMRESGWNQFARNPSSGAYGIPQALPESKLPPAGRAAGGSNPAAQIAWMWNYMNQVYGGPVGAAVHESSFGWYDRGGYLPPGLSLAYNGTGRPERVGGGNVYITVNVGGGVVNGTAVGQQIARYLGQYIKSGGRIYPAGVTPR